jgi:hypothetical protein
MQYGHRIEIQRPLPETFICVDNLLPGHIVSSFDRAVDFVTATQETATILARELRLVTTQRWRGNSKTGRYLGTFYGAAGKVRPDITAPKTRRNFAFDTRGFPVVHFEPRYSSARLLTGRGVRTATDLLTRNLAAMVKTDFRFSAINWRGVDKLIERAARNIVRRAAAHNGPRQTVAMVKQQLWDEIVITIDRQMPLGETVADLCAQDCLDAHPLLRNRTGVVHLPFFDITTPARNHPPRGREIS